MSNYIYKPFVKVFHSITSNVESEILSLEEMRFRYNKEIEQFPTECSGVTEVQSRNLELAKRPFEDDENYVKMKRLKLDISNTANDVQNSFRAVGKTKLDQSLNKEIDSISSTIQKKCRSFIRYGNIRSVSKFKRVLHEKDEEKRLVRLISDIRKEGNVLNKDGNYQGAYNKYTESLSVSSKYFILNSMNYSNRALCLIKMNRFLEALHDCDSAISNDSMNVKAHLRKIKCLIELQRLEEAEVYANNLSGKLEIDECKQLLDIIEKKQYFNNLVDKAFKFQENANYSLALNYINKAIELDPQAELYRRRAALFFALEKYKDSLSDSNEVLNIENSCLVSLDNKANCLTKLERFAESISAASLLTKLCPCKNHVELLNSIQAIERHAKTRNYYEILNVSPTASEEEIKKQYRKLSLLYHPDKNGNCDAVSMAEHEEKFKQLRKIYETLSDPIKRQMYNMEIRQNRRHYGSK